jgi:hypothetical protein
MCGKSLCNGMADVGHVHDRCRVQVMSPFG